MTGDPELTPEGRHGLLTVARMALERALRRGLPVSLNLPDIRRGAFVTLRIGEELRGCLGHVSPDRALGELIPGLAVAAARDDPRFPPLSPEELGRVRIEISVLTTPQVVDPADPAAIVIGRDGLMVERGSARGLLLPQVAPEQGWGPAEFLAATCEKAGLPRTAWREPGTRVLAFQADVFEEDHQE
ncbi:MAG TPA: AmmeMemoRadiSam system protein A [Gemmatimonadales bacterium]|nr:AmmeMemoRadiSam system protein A [Gemmatimonadales bacterium]